MRIIKHTPIGYFYIIIFLIVAAIFGCCVWYFELFKDFLFYEFCVSAFSSFFGGLVLALIFFFLLRPRVQISPYIAETVDSITGKDCYKFKFINHSLFPAFDVKIEAFFCEESNATSNGEGVTVDLNRIKLTRTEWMHVSEWRSTKKKTRYAPHCNTVRTFHEDLPRQIKDNTAYVIFRITLKHAFSNLSSTYRMKYPSERCVKKGEFNFGNDLNIT